MASKLLWGGEDVASVFQLAYTSSLATDGPELLPAIVDVSVRNNKRRSITGVMLYADGCVLQVLEGEKSTVLETFRAIESDKRHGGIFLLIQHEIAARQFANWSMGFRQLTQADLQKFPAAAILFKARPDELTVRSRPGAALTILQSFAEGSMGLI